MFRLFLFGCLLASFLEAKTPYHIAVCGVSRSAEEIELALELIDNILVKKCSDKKLDASIKIQSNSIEAYGPGGLILSQRRSAQVLTEREANKFIVALLKRLAEPKPKAKVEEPKKIEDLTPNPSPPSGEGDIGIGENYLDQSSIHSFPSPLGGEGLGVRFQAESLVSVDQWNYQVSTKAYPGAQLGVRAQLEQWEIGSRAAFGTSAFQIGSQVAWNQQVFVGVTGGRKFELRYGFSVMPKAGYLFWGSFSGLQEIPSFQRQDLDLGADLIFLFPDPKIEMRLLISLLPINLGLQSGVTANYYFTENWFVSLQGRAVVLWAQKPASTFFSGSLGLGVAL
jgi:hypothetical protein